MNIDKETLMHMYGASGGGTPIDISETGLAEISYVRISVDTNTKLTPEIDGFSDVTVQIVGDVDMNGLVNVNDLLSLIGSFGELEIGGPLADFNGDFYVNVTDLLALLGNWS